MLILEIFFAFIIAAIFSNLVEWTTHKYILHGLGKNKNSWFHFHWQHHHISRKHNFVDEDYKLGFFKSSAYRREVFSLIGILLANSWLYFIWPAMFFFCIFFSIVYFFCHSYSHINVEWCKKWLPHHFDHHMGKNQDKNWGVTSPLWDIILGTRVIYKFDDNNKVIK